MKFPFGSQKNGISQYYFGLILAQEEGVGYLVKTNELGQNTIVDKKQFQYSKGWENIIYDIDELLYAIESERNIRVEKIIYFVYAHFIDADTNKIKDHYAESLASISKENKLEPVGYFEFNELIPSYFQSKEGDKHHAVFVEVDTSTIEVNIFEQGKKVFVGMTAKTEDITLDIQELLEKAKSDKELPSRLLVYGPSALRDEIQGLAAHKWKKGLFVHLPKTDLLNDETMDDVLHYGINKLLSGKSNVMSAGSEAGSDGSDENDEDKRNEDIMTETHESYDAKIKVDDDEGELRLGNAMKVESNLTSPVEGFVIGEDFIKDDVPSDLISDSKIANRRFAFLMPKVKIPRFLNDLPKIGGNKLWLQLIGFFAVIAVVVGIAFSGLYFFHKADLTVLYVPDEVKKRVKINGLEITEHSDIFAESASLATTGTKNIGDKAKGEITIYNAQSTAKSFEKGTKLVASNGLTFTLDEAVTAEAGTTKVTEEGDILTTTSKTTAQATASDIGTKSNVAKDTEFTIDGNDTKNIFAKATSAFTGGSEEEIQAVSETDYKNINDSINEKLDQKADDAAQNEKNGKVLTKLTEIDIEEENYSHDIGQESATLELSISAKVTYYTYNENELKELIIADLKRNNSSDNIFTSENIEYSVVSVSEADNIADTTVTVEAKAVSKAKEQQEEVKSVVKGRKKGNLKELLTSSFDFAGYELRISSPLPFLNNTIPYFTKNINVTYKPL